ncbi:hypothetical protein [Azospirillum argentinense]|uniref:hypothetical protein n=1 Tax=Azospirillum argentinense TaxID=2970906 RepID=UPI0032DFA916
MTATHDPAAWLRARARQARRDEPTNHTRALVLEDAADAWERDVARDRAANKRARVQALRDAQHNLLAPPANEAECSP